MSKKHRVIDDEKKLNSPGRLVSFKSGNFSNRNLNEEIQNTNSSFWDEQPQSYVEFSTVKDLLEKVPCNERIELSVKDKIEFTSYLRPILKDELAS